MTIYLASVAYAYLLHACMEKTKTEALWLAIIWPVSLAMLAGSVVYRVAQKLCAQD